MRRRRDEERHPPYQDVKLPSHRHDARRSSSGQQQQQLHTVNETASCGSSSSSSSKQQIVCSSLVLPLLLLLIVFVTHEMTRSWSISRPSSLAVKRFRNRRPSVLVPVINSSVLVPSTRQQTKKKNNNNNKPSQPLCQLCLEIVQKAPILDTSFIKLSSDTSPQAVAWYPSSNNSNSSNFIRTGYHHDETALRQAPPLMNVTPHYLRQLCQQRDDTYTMLKQRPIAVASPTNHTTRGVHSSSSSSSRIRLFCLVYTTASGHSKIQRIRETWGPKCDGFVVGSTITDPTVDAIHVPHSGPEVYQNIWQKVRVLWRYVYDHYYETYDWFHIGGDDLYLIVEHLQQYLESDEIRTAAHGGIYLPEDDELEHQTNATTWQVPLFLGARHWRAGNRADVYNDGGAGYTLNKAALKLLVVYGLPNYFVDTTISEEDVMVARVFRQFGVYPYPTKDETGAERYNVFSPGKHYRYQMLPNANWRDRPYFDPYGIYLRVRGWIDWYSLYHTNSKQGLDHSSRSSVAFHEIYGDDMYRLTALLYNLCP